MPFCYSVKNQLPIEKHFVCMSAFETKSVRFRRTIFFPESIDDPTIYAVIQRKGMLYVNIDKELFSSIFGFHHL